MSRSHQVAGHTLTLLRNGEEYFRDCLMPSMLQRVPSILKPIFMQPTAPGA